MHDHNAAQLLAKVMDWRDLDAPPRFLPTLQLLADYKYDHYQQFGPGRRFIESLALWLDQFSPEDREAALELVTRRLVYFSDAEFTHLVSTAYPDLIVQECMRLVAEEHDISAHLVGKISGHPRFNELRLKSLYLGLSDGARTNELRRASGGDITNEQIWQAYELSDEKADDMLKELKASLTDSEFQLERPRFNLIWLLDDFSGSGNTYIRYDSEKRTFKGKIRKIYERLHRGDLVDTSHYEVFLLLYTATRQAIDHIEYWSERFTSEKGYKPLQVRVLCPIEPETSLKRESDPKIRALLEKTDYYDARATDKHIAVGGTSDARMGFAGCALPVVLSHNSPNNSIYMLWGPESNTPFGLFPRVSRHREF
ncbi:phosphoribosyltransferase-like protein [Allopusillimonas ginsengisoli]|uniref:phosphoribosyltransferase-like protein n=1 Tax=Allopusillimonas ginsengisoli TaxID=453575 RepID=UPI0010228045|nr:hypothetical protein [Allopusillimonas ginsengisoli]TEA79238.1 hypothetical protein ERE07_07630 [Allopusillimonas ginsengisoli]